MSSPEPNYYQILGVGCRVDQATLKKAFHYLTKRYHPDKNPVHVDTFKEISRAYRVLSDPEQRKAYDAKLQRSPIFSTGSLFRTNAFANFRQPCASAASGQNSCPSTGDRNGCCQQHFFRGGGHQSQPGANARAAFIPTPSCGSGHTTTTNHVPSGTWDTSRVQIVRCAVCHGTGTVARYERLGQGLMREIRVLCMTCSGRGTWCKLYSIRT